MIKFNHLWYLLHICCDFAIIVDPFFRAVLLPLTVMVVNLVVEFVFGLIISLYTASNVTNEQCY